MLKQASSFSLNYNKEIIKSKQNQATAVIAYRGGFRVQNKVVANFCKIVTIYITIIALIFVVIIMIIVVVIIINVNVASGDWSMKIFDYC